MYDNRWDKLLSNKRFRPLSSQSPIDNRDDFENDYSRLISSAPIRRLQDKTQVFPFEKSDFIRTRLTHSLEVSSIGRGIGKSLEKILINRGKLDPKYIGCLSSLLMTGGLVHDLGNPPFGHFGEEAIKHFFKEYFKNQSCGFSKQEMDDFRYFDGNCQTFRILRKLHYLKDEHSFNLSFPTLSLIIKYPNNSISGNKRNYKQIGIEFKKFGYFTSEEDDYKTIGETLGNLNKRHPLTFLLEAADDIAYSAADIEDGVKLGILNYENIYDTFSKELGSNHQMIKTLEADYKDLSATNLDKTDLIAQRFRIASQSAMIPSIIDEFDNNYEEILSGNYHFELLDRCEASKVRNGYKQLLPRVLGDKNIISKELGGWEIINGILKSFVEVTDSDNFSSKGSNSKENRQYNMISSSYRYIYENYNKYHNEKYNKLQLVTDFVSGMTDTFALNLYQRLHGISI